ncbi:MAG: crotonase/enoyl-CoA hydratase family protein [Candidatus Phaeomarinobacter sp.]
MKPAPALIDQNGSVIVITLNRPEARNAINQDMAHAVAAAVDRLDQDPELTVGILAGNEQSFSSGMDLKAFLRGETPMIEGRGLAGITETPPKKPLIAAVDGFALAGGCELALACDMIVASKGATFGLPEVKRGLIAGGGGVVNLPRRIPRGLAMEIVLTGEPVTATRAYDLGLVNRLTVGPALDEAMKLADVIAKNAPLAVQVSKQVVLQSQDWSLDELYPRQNQLIGPVIMSKDAQEGAAAYAEKRKPAWRGE